MRPLSFVQSRPQEKENVPASVRPIAENELDLVAGGWIRSSGYWPADLVAGVANAVCYNIPMTVILVPSR